MKSLTKRKNDQSTKKSAKEAAKAAHAEQKVVQIPLPVFGVLKDVEHAFLGLCASAGASVLQAMMEADREALCGVKGVPDAQRQAIRAGSVCSAVTLGGQRITMKRLRARSLPTEVDGHRSAKHHNQQGRQQGRQQGQGTGLELQLPSFQWASARDPLDRATLAAIGAGVSTRRYASTMGALPEGLMASSGASDSPSSVSRRFVALSAKRLQAWLSRSLTGMNIPVVMIDGIHYRERIILLVLGIDADGKKHILGLHEGHRENTSAVSTLLSELVARGLDPQVPRLWVIDGGGALRKGITHTFGDLALMQRCQEHKRRNVLDHLPETMHASVSRSLRDAWESQSVELAKRQLQTLANGLERNYPSAAASVREGLMETLTLQSLGVTGLLYKSLRTTNPIENLNGTVARYARNVTRWRDGSMILRWVASALTEAEKGFKRLRGYADMNALIIAINRRVKPVDQQLKKVA